MALVAGTAARPTTDRAGPVSQALARFSSDIRRGLAQYRRQLRAKTGPSATHLLTAKTRKIQVEQIRDYR